jgi:cytochrome c biogenesis protein CcdA/glutaredoxin
MCHRRSLSPVAMILLALILMLVLLGFSWKLVPVQASEPVVRGVLFWAETCPHCHEVMDRHLPPLEEKHGDQLQIRAIEVSDPAHYQLWLATMDAYQVPTEQGGVPMLFIGDTVLIGSGEISEKLPGLIEQHLAEGSVDYPTIPGLENALGLTPTPAADLTPCPTPTVTTCYMCDEDILPHTPTPADDVAVHFWLFYSSKCSPCYELKEEILPPILSKYEEGQVVIDERDLEHGSYELMRSLEKQHGLEYGAMPEIFIGEHVLLGNEEIEARLELLIDTYLAQGGIDLPQASTPTPTPEATVPEEAGGPPIHLAYFYQPGCQECDRVQLALNYLQDQYPQLTVCTLDVKEQATLCEWLGERASVPVGKRLTAPAVFVGDDALVGEELHTSSLEALLARYAETGAEPICVGWEAASDETVSGIIERFRSFSLPTVLVAGLVDGLNPCAFATLVFFISYLAFMGREGREVLLAGGTFALGVFLTYLGVGFGVLKFLATLPFLDAASRWIYGLTAAFCLLLAVGSLYDWWQARRGKATEMRLKMPTRLRRWVNRTIREGAGAGALVPVTFATGVVVSIIELACTGQVYLPTILFVLGVPELQVRAGLYLVLYNLMFILPLVVVFVLAYFGTTSQQLGLLIHRHTATVKLATAGLFFLLAGWMVVTLI